MNKHVELAKKWLADNDSVTLKEVEANEESAFWAAKDDYEANFLSSKVAYKVADAARAAKAFYWVGDADGYAEYCKNKAIEAVKEYEELTK